MASHLVGTFLSNLEENPSYYLTSSVSRQDGPNSMLWLATWAGKIGLLTKCEIKMAGYWSSYFFVCLWTEMETRSINTQKKNEADIQPSWPHTWSITHTSCLFVITHCILQQNHVLWPYNKSLIDQACSVKMAGYWFVCLWTLTLFVRLWTLTSPQSMNMQKKKKNLANIQPSWPHVWSITHVNFTATSKWLLWMLLPSVFGFSISFKHTGSPS